MHGALAGPDSRALPVRPTSPRPRPDRSASAPSRHPPAPRSLEPAAQHSHHRAAAAATPRRSVITVPRAGHAGGKRTAPARDSASRLRPTHRLAIMRKEDACSTMFDMSIQEVNGKGPKKRKKSLDICDSPGRERAEKCSEHVAPEAACGAGAGEERVQLLHWRDMPRHLQFNPYVLTGYRPLQSAADCVRSLFYFHNETINILTHGVSLVYMMMVLPGLLPWGGGGAWFLSLCHLLGAMAPWCGSFLYHLFMNHTHGEALYHRLLQLDMLGIWVSQSIGAIPMVTATVYCAPALLRYGALAVYCLGSLLGLYKAMRAWSPWERRLCFAAPFCMRLLLAGARAARVGGGDPNALLHVFLQDAVSLGGGVIGAMHIPEKWFPGTVDRCLNSHNIMHVLVVLAVYSMHQVTTRDLEWMSRVDCHAPLRHL